MHSVNTPLCFLEGACKKDVEERGGCPWLVAKGLVAPVQGIAHAMVAMVSVSEISLPVVQRQADWS